MTFAKDISACMEVLKKGGTILYPTDTIWGLGCDATNEKAVARIYSLKKRKESKSMIILVAEESDLKNYCDLKSFPDGATLKKERPVTIIYPHAKNLAKNVIAKDGSVAIRIAGDEFCKLLIKAYGKPIVSTSANFSGSAAPRIYDEICEEIKSGADYIVQHRRNDFTIAKPSIILKWKNDGSYSVIRD